jgi:DNA mismatch repair protein MutS
METQHHTKKYIEFHEKYTKKYGENTVVLMQAGSHFNIFAIINDEVNLGPDIYHICQNVLNNSLQVTKQNKKKAEISYGNCLLAGFPIYCIGKYEKLLLNSNYTVVIVEQITAPPNPERGVTRIVSPGTTIEDYNNSDTRYLMSVYIEKNAYMNKDVFITGLSTIDLSTGKNKLHYFTSKDGDNGLWNDEIGRYIHFYNPSEILFQFDGFTMSKNDIIQRWDIPHNSIQINHYSEKEYKTTSYQNEFMQKIFNLNIMMTPIEHFDLEMKSEVVISYVYMLQYITDHLVNSLDNIELPELMSDTNCLCLTSNSIRQLNVINNYSYFKGKNESLLSICNLCVTTMGRRLFKERLIYPSVDPEVIEKRYDYIDLFRENKLYEVVYSELRKVSDLEKSLRKMGLNILQRNDFFSDTLSFEYVNKFMKILFTDEKLVNPLVGSGYDKKVCQPFINFYEECKTTFIFHNLTQFGNLERSILQEGISDDMDNYDIFTDTYHNDLLKIGERLSGLLDSSETSIKVDVDDRNDWFLYCTNKRATTLKERLSNLNDNSIHVKIDGKTKFSFKKDDFTFKKKDGSSTIIQFSVCKELSRKLIDIQDKIKKSNRKEWEKRMVALFEKYNVGLKKFYFFLSEIDCYCAGAKLSIQNGYNRPKIVVDQEKSFLDCSGIRHPIVEKIHTDTEYVKNDIILGKDEKDGILLFGTNACGKSTFMKAVGLNIIMAQAGLFVAADRFMYKPYSQIFTRILNNDNIFRSQSSFAVEIQELKSILNRADKDSLILGDELCSGTETTSALCIITAGLKTLCDRASTFIFTSHLHELTKLEEVKALPNLLVYHLKIEYDEEKDILIYDRKLAEGSGPSIYGLKVCEAMGLTKEFISFAKGVQNNFERNNILTKKKSQYNKDIFMDECKMCFKKSSPSVRLETHHIKDQQFADKNNMIDGHHKNVKHNLVPLCKECHLRVTNGEISMDGWKTTNQGKILIWKECSKKIVTKKKFSEEDIKKIVELRSEYGKLSQKDFIKKLELDDNIKISVGTLKKMIDNKY